MTTFPFTLDVQKKDTITSISLVPKPSPCNSALEQDIINAWLDKTRDVSTLVSLEHLPTFQKKVLTHLRTLKHDETTTYGAIAKAIGHPGAARAVGSALANNPFILIFPCHKVIRADGSLGNFSCQTSSRDTALALKKALIDYERHYNDTNT